MRNVAHASLGVCLQNRNPFNPVLYMTFGCFLCHRRGGGGDGADAADDDADDGDVVTLACSRALAFAFS